MGKKRLNRIKYFLCKNGRSQVWISKQLGKSPFVINRYCNNVIQPDEETLRLISELLKVNPEKLVVLMEEEPEKLQSPSRRRWVKRKRKPGPKKKKKVFRWKVIKVVIRPELLEMKFPEDE